jgi:hypothetical protein
MFSHEAMDRASSGREVYTQTVGPGVRGAAAAPRGKGRYRPGWRAISMAILFRSSGV